MALPVTGELSLLSYVLRVAIALTIISVGAFFFVRHAKSKGWVKQNGTHVEVIASLPIGKDVFFVLRCGPDVFALTSGNAGTRLIGRWKYEEWLGWEEKERQKKEIAAG